MFYVYLHITESWILYIFVLPISDEHTAIYSTKPVHNQDMRHYLLCENFKPQTATSL